MTAPIFSIIVATYHRASLLHRALTSILAQDFSAFEVLVVDGSSNDKAHEVVKAFADPRLRYVHQVDNAGGVSHARNLGIDHASGDYIVFVDDDDTIAPSFLTKVYREFSQAPPHVGFLWTWKRFIEESVTGIKEGKLCTYNIENSHPLPGHDYLKNLHGGSGGLVVRSTALKMVGGFDPEFNSVEDTELMIRLAKRFDFMVLPENLYSIFIHSGEQLSTDSLRTMRVRARILDTYYEDLKTSPLVLDHWCKKTAKYLYRYGDRATGRRILLQVIRNRPLYWRYWFLLFLLENLNYLPPFVSHKIVPKAPK